MSEPDFVKGASGPSQAVSLSSPGQNYLGGATATATSSSSGSAGTSFPSTPANGDLFIYTADGTAGVFWSFIWYAANSYWGFVGGSRLYNEVLTSEGTSSTSYTDLSTGGPSVTAPFAGDFDVFWGAGSKVDTANSGCMVAFKRGSASTSDSDKAIHVSGTATGQANEWVAVSGSRRIVGATAGEVIKLQYRADSGGGTTATFIDRWVAIVPVKTT